MSNDHTPQPGGGWISGTPTTSAATAEPVADTRPEFNPSFLLHEILRLLREHRVTVRPDAGQRHVAEIAAADLLRAVGVRPVSAPRR